MKRIIIVLTIFTLLYGLSNAQTPRSVNVELLGVHNLVGVSFDSRFKENSKFGYKIGIGYGYENSTYSDGAMYEFGGKNAAFRTSPVGFLRSQLLKNVVSFPLNIYYLFGETNKFFELGGGIVPYYAGFKNRIYWNGTYQNSDFNQFKYYAFLQTAYRYEGAKFLYSIGLDIPFKTPSSDLTQAIGIYPKISVGYKL